MDFRFFHKLSNKILPSTLSRSIHGTPDPFDLIARDVLSKHSTFLMAQYGVHHIFDAGTVIRVMGYYSNNVIPSQIETIPVEFYVASEFESMLGTFSLSDEKDVPTHTELTFESIDHFCDAFDDKYGIHGVFDCGRVLNVFGFESKDVMKKLKLPDNICNGSVEIKYHQVSAFDGMGDRSSIFDQSSNAWCVSRHGNIANGTRIGNKSTYGCLVEPLPSHPHYLQLCHFAAKNDYVFACGSGHGVLPPVVSAPPQYEYTWGEWDFQKYRDFAAAPTLYAKKTDASKAPENWIGKAMYSILDCQTDLSIFYLRKNAADILLASPYQGSRDLYAESCAAINRTEYFDQLHQEQFYAILANDVIPVTFWGQMESRHLKYRPWGENYPAFVIEKALSFHASDWKDNFGAGDSGCVVVDKNGFVVSSGVCKAHCNSDGKQVDYGPGIKSPPQGNVICGDGVRAFDLHKWKVKS